MSHLEFWVFDLNSLMLNDLRYILGSNLEPYLYQVVTFVTPLDLFQILSHLS